MKNIYVNILMCCVLYCIISCSGNDDIGAIDQLTPDYELPQGKSDADNRIVEYYNQYGSFILYEYTQLDFIYGGASAFEYELPDPQYVGDMLDLLEDIWFDFYPAEFHQKYMPYRIFLAKYIQQVMGSSVYPLFTVAGTNCQYVGYCSDTLQKITPATKLSFKNDIQAKLWNQWILDMELPEDFFNVSDYTTAVDAYTPESPNYARTRGFVADYTYGYANEWSGSLTSYTREQCEEMDAKAFIVGMVYRTSEEWASDLVYPLVKKKYDILRNYFFEEYNFDIQKVGDVTYE